MPYMVTFTINIPQMLPYMAYMDPMGYATLGKPIDQPVLHEIFLLIFLKAEDPAVPQTQP